MIYIFAGSDAKKINISIKKLVKDSDMLNLTGPNVSKESLDGYARNISLFGESPVVIIDNLLSDSELAFSNEELTVLKDSPTIFILREDKLLSINEKKYFKFATIERFENKIAKSFSKINPFSIADSFAHQDKIKTWVLYREAIEAGVPPESISGMLFWKIKTMILSGSRVFPNDNLKKFSSELVSIYHKSHRGETDFTIGLEQFILSSLSK